MERNVPGADQAHLDDLDLLRSQPPTPDVEIALGNYFLRHGLQDSALAHYDAALTLDPENVAALNTRGIVLGRMGRWDEAEKVFHRAIEIEPLYLPSYTNLGNLHFRREEFSKAITEYRLASSIDTTDATNWFNLGLAYEKVGDLNPAILSYNKVIQLDPENPKPHERLGWIYYGKKLYKGARDQFRLALELDPTRDDLRDNIFRLQEWADSTGTR